MNEQLIINEYLNNYGVMELSKKYECHRSTIQRLLKKNNIKLRKKTPSLKYNINFFNQYTPESCYWAGFIAADGCVRSDRNTLEIKLSFVDVDHLIKFKHIINYDGDVKKYKYKNGYEYCSISISGEHIINSLKMKFNITPQKTFNIEIYNKIPNNMIKHFIRGYFDGDGCVTKTTCPSISFVSGSIKLLQQLQKQFYNINIRLKSKNIYPPIQNKVQINYSGKNAKLILNWLYSNTNTNIRMDRKYNKYIKLFN